MHPSRLKCLLLLGWSLLLYNCSSTPSRIAATAQQYGLQETVVAGDYFEHKVFFNRRRQGDYVHVYIPGDGVPWKYRFFVSANPGPKASAALSMLAQDSHPALYIGRPCCHQLHRSRHCQSDYWTAARFSPEVVNSMLAALKAQLAQWPEKKVILFGFSGGGALVMLMAPHIPHLEAVVTVAGNLNSDLWTKQHHYSPMKRSLNPFNQPSLDRRIRQFHLVGSQDKNITPAISQSYVAKHGGDIWPYPDYTHSCCWLDAWPMILRDVHKKLAK